MTLTPNHFLDRSEAVSVLEIFGVDRPETELDTAGEVPKLGDSLPVYGKRSPSILLVRRIPSTSGDLYLIDFAYEDKRYYDPRCSLDMSHTIRVCGYHCGTYTERQWYARDNE
jgi:hypothetical protein